MMADTAQVGDLVRITGTFTNAGGTAVDPSGTVTFYVLTPAGATTSYAYGAGSVVKSSTGIYYLDVPAITAGRWNWRVDAGGTTGYSAQEDYFDVSYSRFSGSRSGMNNIIHRWRRLVDDTAGSVWGDWQAQEMLDGYRVDVWGAPLTYVPQKVDNTTVYKVYQSPYRNLEEIASGTTVFRVSDANGTTWGTSNWTADYQRGVITFGADQVGSARYLDARAYNLNAAAAHGWRERAALTSGYYAFETDGQIFSRQQYYEHCMQMAVHFDTLASYGADAPGGGGGVTYLDRTDIDGNWP